MFEEYPEVIDIFMLMSMLHIGKNSAYDLLKSGEIKCWKSAGKYRLTKKAVLEYIERQENDD